MKKKDAALIAANTPPKKNKGYTETQPEVEKKTEGKTSDTVEDNEKPDDGKKRATL